MSLITDIASIVTRPLQGFAMACLLLVAAGCGESAVCGGMPDEELPSPDAECLVGFEIVVGNSAGPSTRAPQKPEGGYAPGEGYENHIDIPGRDFRILFFAADTGKDDKLDDSRYIGQMFVESVRPVASVNPEKKRYYVMGGMPQAHTGKIVGKQVQVVVLANWGTEAYTNLDLKPEVTSITGLCADAAGIYTYKAREFPSAANLIPLFGVTNPMVLDFDAFNFAHLGTIHLLRAVAKIEVQAESGTHIKSVRLSHYNMRGYCAPTGVIRNDDYVHNDYVQDYANTPHLVENSVADEPLYLNKVVNDDGRFLIYVPEYGNLQVQDDVRAKLWITFEGEEKEHTIPVEFKYYNDMPGGKKGDHFDILRNYWYKFNVTGVLGDMEVVIDVRPYSEVELEPGFGL